jgi:hypothetical protein
MSDPGSSASPTEEPAPVPGERATRWSRHRIAFLAGAAVLVVLALVGAFLLVTRDDDTQDQVATTTTSAEPATTSGEPATTAEPTTTVTVVPVPVTVGPTYPSALGRHLVPWDRIGDGWTLVVYDGCSSPEANDPAVVYLVDPDGTRYEITTLPTDERLPGAPCRPQEHLLDWVVQGDVALLGQSCCDLTVAELVDLRTGERTELLTLGRGTAGLTRPTGAQLIAAGDLYDVQPTVWRMARYDREGDVQVVFEDVPIGEPDSARHHTSWLSTPDGTALVLGGGWGDDAPALELVANDVSGRRPLDTPGVGCEPVRWWDPDTALVHCRMPGTDALRGLWLVPIDGAASTLLTDPGPDCAARCGHVDAWPVGDALLVQRVGAQGEGQLERVEANGEVAVLPVPGTSVAVRGLQVHDGRILALQQDLATGSGELVSTAMDGSDVRVLVTPTGGTHGVVSALSPMA